MVYDNNQQVHWLETQQYDLLFKSVEKFIWKKALQYENIVPDKNEAFSMGSSVFMECVQKYDPNRNAKFISFLGLMLDQCYLMENRKQKRNKKYGLCYLNDTISLKDGTKVEIKDTIKYDQSDIENLIIKKIQREVFHDHLNQLEDKSQDIIKLMLKNYKQKEIAQMLGLSQAYISRLEKKIILSIKKELI